MTIKMNNIEYEIKEVCQKEYKEYRKNEDKELELEESDLKKGVYYGATHTYKNIIFIDKNLNEDKKKKTLIHELTHCYINEYMTHEEKGYNEEDVCDIVANSYEIIHNIIKMYFEKSY